MKCGWEKDSESIVLECYRCRELIVLLGHEEDWYAEEHSFFECQCGQKLTLAAKRR
jgi:hypothetical protein